jgi:NADH-quinone oxidoreductase subunit M
MVLTRSTAFKFFLYTLLGSLLMLIALIYLYNQSGGSFDIAAWHKMPLSSTAQTLLFFAFFAAFAVKVPMWPVHTWLPDVRGGSYGWFRRAGGHHAEAGRLWFPALLAAHCSRCLARMGMADDCLSLVAVIYVGLVAMVKDMKNWWRTLRSHTWALSRWASSSSMTWASLAVVQMIAHGFVSGAMFLSLACCTTAFTRVSCCLWWRRQHHAQLHCVCIVVCHGQLRAAGTAGCVASGW